MRAADTVRAAFAIGYARAGADAFPIPARAKAGAVAAMRAAESMPPGRVVEATLQLGSLEGTWAVVYRRRERLEASQQSALTDVLADVAAHLDVGGIVTLLANLPTFETVADSDTTAAAITALRREFAALAGTDVWGAWRAVLREAIVSGTAEGDAVALALMADAAGVSIDFDLAFTDAHDALADLDSMWADVDGWLAKQVDGLVTQLGRTLADAWASGATRAEMVTAVKDLLGGGTNAAATVLDMAIGQALSAGSLATYAQAGLQVVDFLTAGDDRVDEECDDAETNGPYLLDACPQPPLHPNCRCCVAPSLSSIGDVTDLTALWEPYVTGGDS